MSERKMVPMPEALRTPPPPLENALHRTFAKMRGVEHVRLVPQCVGCHSMCCALNTVVYADEVKTGKYLTDPHPRPLTRGEHLLQKGADGMCIYWNKGCSIYADRPRSCREFDCRNYCGGPDAILQHVKPDASV